MVLRRDEILNASDLKRELVSVPEWGGDVYVRELTGRERDELNALRDSDMAAFKRVVHQRLVRYAVVDDDGKPLFTEEDETEIGSKSFEVLERLCGVVMRLSGLSKEAQEELAKNSKGTPTDGSSSD